MFWLHSCFLPCDGSVHSRKNKEQSVSLSEYAKVVGSLMYWRNYMQPNIAYAVGWLSHYTYCPDKDYWTALHPVQKYLKGTIIYSSIYCGFPFVLEGSWRPTGSQTHMSWSPNELGKTSGEYIDGNITCLLQRVKNDGNPTCIIGNFMEYLYMVNNKLFDVVMNNHYVYYYWEFLSYIVDSANCNG